MHISIKTMDDFIKNIDTLPAEVIKDIDKRISDWLSSGGSVEASYIKQQLKYAENIINIMK